MVFNAIDAMPGRHASPPNHGDTVSITISDTGVGMYPALSFV
jgi:hypothetical protein